MIDLTDYTGPDAHRSWLCILNEVTGAALTSTVNWDDAVAVRSPLTYTGWAPPSPPVTPEYVIATFTTSRPVNYVALLVTEGGGATFQPEYWDGAAWQAIGAPMVVAAGDRDVLLWLFDQVTTTNVRMAVSAAVDIPVLSVLKAGIGTPMPRCIGPGWGPSALNPSNEYSNVMSQGGQVLAAELQSREIEESLSFTELQPTWVRANWPALRDAVRREGIVFAWRPDTYPDELAYGMISGSPAVAYSSHQRMSLTINMKGPAL